MVDDGSNDTTEALIATYCKKNSRFKYHQRQVDRPKGGNTCRNIGLEKSKGDFIVFFDSDDIMVKNHVEVKIKAILKYDCDYVIAKTNYFNNERGNINLKHKYNFNSSDISAYNYISQKINWLTYDVCIKAEIAKSINFNELLKSGQEFNYFSKLTLKTTHAIFVNEIITLRRYHDESIRGNIRSNKLASFKSAFNSHWCTYKDINKIADDKINKYLIYKCIKLAIKHPKVYEDFRSSFFKSIFMEYKWKGFYQYARLIKYAIIKPKY